MRKTVIILMAIGLIILIIKVFVLLIQDRFVFLPDPNITLAPTSVGLPFEDVNFHSSDRTPLHGWFIRGEPGAPVILFFQGNAGNIGYCLEFVRFLKPLKASWFLFDYRQYGKSGGVISEEGFYKDALSAWDVCRQKYCPEHSKLVLWGFSLGSVAATYVGSNRSADAIILEAPFVNAAAMAKQNPILQFLNFFSSLSLNNAANIRRCEMPKLLIHGTQDNMIPVSHSQSLVHLAPAPCEIYLVEGADHNNLFIVGGQAYINRVQEFLNKYVPTLPRLEGPATTQSDARQ